MAESVDDEAVGLETMELRDPVPVAWNNAVTFGAAKLDRHAPGAALHVKRQGPFGNTDELRVTIFAMTLDTQSKAQRPNRERDALSAEINFGPTKVTRRLSSQLLV